jgi:hypothetical protein
VTLGVQVNSTEVAKVDAAGTNLGFPGDRAGPSAGAFVLTLAVNNTTGNLEQLVVAQWANPGNPIKNKLVALGISPIEAKVVVEVEDAVENRTLHGSVKDALGRIFKVEAEAPFRGAAIRQVPVPPFRPRFLTVDPLAPITGTLFDFAFQGDLTSLFTSGVGGAEIEVNFSKAKPHKTELRLPHGKLPVELPAQIPFAMVDGLQIFFQRLPGQ